MLLSQQDDVNDSGSLKNRGIGLGIIIVQPKLTERFLRGINAKVQPRFVFQPLG